MIQGSTPKHTFKLPFDTSLIDKIRVTYAQNGIPLLTKEKEDCTLEGDTVTIRLSQEETLKFDENARVQVQIKAKSTDEDVTISKILSIPLYPVLDKEVI